MASISGNAKKYDGTAIDYVMVFDWGTGDCMGTATPDGAGDWHYAYYNNINVGISYIADGCEPITHGPYNFIGEWSPAALFQGGSNGFWYDPSDLSTLFQDVAGTVPVTTDGDLVALMLDKSGNDNHATQTVSTARPIYKTDEILHWLQFDGVDDHLRVSSTLPTPVMHLTLGVSPVSVSSIFRLVSKGNIADTAIDGDWLISPNQKNNLRLFSGRRHTNKATVVTPNTVDTNIYTYMIGAATQTIGINNTYLVSDFVQTQSNTNAILIGIDSNSEYPLQGKLHSIVLCVDTLSTNNKDLLYNHVATKAGVAL